MKIEVISPFPLESLPRVWGWTEKIRSRVSDDFGPQNLEQFVEAMLMAEGEQKTWAVYADGELGGMITFQRLSPWIGTAHIFCKPDFQGKGLAPPALKIAFHEMFQTGIGKLSFYPLGAGDGMSGHSSGLAVGSLLVNLGAKREGCLRAQTLCGGKPTAMNIYGLLKEEFYHALGANRSRGNRGDQLDPRGVPEREAEDHHDHHDADLVARNDGAFQRPGQLRQRTDERSLCRDGAD